MLSFGQLFGSNFWSSFKAQPSESIEKLLSKDDCALSDLLNDSDLLQECKNSNKNLIKYLNREKIRELIDLITVLPEADEHNRGHKYPFLANEVFNCDITEVIDRFFISPADDVVEEEPDEQVIEDDTNKFEPGFEKDNDDSNTDSEEEDNHHEAEGEEHDDEHEESEKKDVATDSDAKKVDESAPEESKVDAPEETIKKEDDTVKEETKQEVQPQEEDVKVVEESKVETPVAEVENQQDDNKDVAPENTQNESAVANTENAQDAASPATEETKVVEAVKEESKESEVTPEVVSNATEALLDNNQNEQDSFNDSTQDNYSTHASEATTEMTVKEEEKEPLSTNKYDLIDYLNRFIETDDQLNDVLSGYYARLCTILIQKKSDEVAKYFFKNEKLLYRLAYHSYSKSITDTVIKILDINTDKLDLEEGEVARVRKEFVHKLLERLADETSEVAYEYSLNIFQIFNELTFKRAFYTILIDDQVVSKLRGVLFSATAPECSSNASIRIMNVLISHLRDHLSNSTQSSDTQNHFLDDNDEVVMEDNREADQEQTKSTEELLKDHSLVKFFHNGVIDHLVELLEKSPQTVTLDFQHSDNQFVLGKKRLACVNLLESLVELDDIATRKRLQESNFYEFLFNLFLEYRFNTFLHLHLDNIFHRILKDPNTSNEDKVTFVKKLKIFEKLPSFWSDNQHFAYPSQREFRH